MPPSSIPLEPVSAEELLELGSVTDAELRSPSLRSIDFSRRAQMEEMMDQPCSYEELRACLHDIARVNRLTFAHRPILAWLAKVIESRPEHAAPLRIVDVGCGYGDTLRRISDWAARRGAPVVLTGIDLNPDAIRAARDATPCSATVEWRVGDALSGRFDRKIDVVICSLLTHHLTDIQIIRFLRWMEGTARVGWFVNDLHRRPLPYHLFRLWARLADWHPFVKHDGPVSIRRSFVAEDWRTLCAQAGLSRKPVLIEESWPARLCVRREK